MLPCPSPTLRAEIIEKEMKESIATINKTKS